MDPPETGKHFAYEHVYKKKWVNSISVTSDG